MKSNPDSRPAQNARPKDGPPIDFQRPDGLWTPRRVTHNPTADEQLASLGSRAVVLLIKHGPLIGTVISVAALLSSVPLRIAYSTFYSAFGLQPEDVGNGYVGMLAQSWVGLLISLFFAVMILMAVVLLGIAALFLLAFMADLLGTGVKTRIGGALLASHAIYQLIAGTLGSGARDLPARFLEASGFFESESQLAIATIGLVFVTAELLLGVNIALSPSSGLRLLDRIMEYRSQLGWQSVLFLGSIGLLTALAFLTGSLIVTARTDGLKARGGYAVHEKFMGITVFGWEAEPARVYWSQSTSQEAVTADQSCLMFLGRANGVSITYNAHGDQVVRVPDASGIVTVGHLQRTCTRPL